MRKDKDLMCSDRLVACVLLLGTAAQFASAQSATLLVRTDLECRWSIDGEPKGVLKVDDRVRLSLQLGEHLIEAVATSGGARWEKVVKLTEPTQQVFTIPLLALKADAELTDRGYWIDPDTRLMWAAHDNGYDVNWNQALSYCQSLTVGEYRGWTLPRNEELAGLETGKGIKGGIKLTRGGEWSSSRAPSSREAWQFWLGIGKQNTFDRANGNDGRALCVRHTGQ